MQLPKGRIPNDALAYCVGKVGGSIEPILENGERLFTIKLGNQVFTDSTNRGLVERIFQFVATVK